MTVLFCMIRPHKRLPDLIPLQLVIFILKSHLNAHYLRIFLSIFYVVCAGVIDSSGIKFHVTKTLRKYDAGIMKLGMEYTDKYALPPKLDLWSLSGYCVPECTAVVCYFQTMRILRTINLMSTS